MQGIDSNVILVPYPLSMWAIFHERDPAPRFYHGISNDAYSGKAISLLTTWKQFGIPYHHPIGV